MTNKREIKFRGWDKINKKWIDLFELKFSGAGAVMGIVDLEGEAYGRHQVELSEYTGLKDKNGKEIYEGDILQFSDKWEWFRGEFAGGCLATKEDVEEIENNHEKYPYERRAVSIPDGYEWLLSSEIQSYWEVIGNIYENPELLTQQND